MNKKIETQKIKVNNWTELISEAKKWKNSGGEWKLLERYWTQETLNSETARGKKHSGTSSSEVIKISNREQAVEIIFELDTEENFDANGKLITTLPIQDGSWEKLCELFPEVAPARRIIKKDEMYHHYPVKLIKKGEREYRLGRYLTAWNLIDVAKILVEYHQANKTKINQSPNFDQWVKIVENEPNNNGYIFLYVGDRKSNDDGELEIALKNDEEITGNAKMRLEGFWECLISNRKNPGNQTLISSFDDVRVGFNYDRDTLIAFHTDKRISGSEERTLYSIPGRGVNKLPTPFSPANKISETEKNQIRQYFCKKKIRQITLDNGKLVIEYNNLQKETKEVNNQELEALKNIIKKYNNSVNYADLKINSSSSTANQPNKPDYTFWIVGGIGAVLLAGIFAYWIRKRKNK